MQNFANGLKAIPDSIVNQQEKLLMLQNVAPIKN